MNSRHDFENYDKTRYSIIKWMIETELDTFQEECNIEIIFTAVEIFDKFCLNRSKTMNIDVVDFLKKNKKFIKTIASSCLILSAQYHDDHYEYVRPQNLTRYGNIYFPIFQAIEFNIFPSKHLLNLYEFSKTMKLGDRETTNAFLAMIFSLLYYNTATFNLLEIYKDPKFIKKYNENKNFVKDYIPHTQKLLTS